MRNIKKIKVKGADAPTRYIHHDYVCYHGETEFKKHWHVRQCWTPEEIQEYEDLCSPPEDERRLPDNWEEILYLWKYRKFHY